MRPDIQLMLRGGVLCDADPHHAYILPKAFKLLNPKPYLGGQGDLVSLLIRL